MQPATTKRLCFLGNKTTRLKIEIPRLNSSFTGTGDLFAALFLAWMHKSDNDLKQSLEKTVASLQAVLKRTLQYADGCIAFYVFCLEIYIIILF